VDTKSYKNKKSWNRDKIVKTRRWNVEEMGRTAKGNATAEAKAQIREANTAEAGLGNICWSLIARAIISAPAKENRRDRPVMNEDEDT
jgi:hypothetical protein